MSRPPIHRIPDDLHPLVRQYVELCARRRKPADVQGLAKSMKVPATRLAQVLRERYDSTPTELIWREQVRLAKVILTEEPEVALIEVARRSGVNGVRSLNRIFQRVEGVPPGALRGSRR